MSRSPDEVVAVRSAVRSSLADLPAGALVLVALSGGPDSLALAAVAAFVAPRLELRAGAVVVDHRLQTGSADVAEHVRATAESLGLDPAVVARADVGTEGGPEAAARTARYRALAVAADQLGAAVVLLGHTLDDQAETVLLGLARGSGARSLAGMRATSGRYRRPLLDLTRTTTRACCEQLSLSAWSDPHNVDRRFARVRLRLDGIPALAAALGPGVEQSLARTARLLRDDDDALLQWADRVLGEARVVGLPEAGLDVAVLAAAPAAVRRRVLRHVCMDAGVPGGSLTAEHLQRLDDLVAQWRGQGAVALPGAVHAERRCGRLYLAGDVAGSSAPATAKE